MFDLFATQVWVLHEKVTVHDQDLVLVEVLEVSAVVDVIHAPVDWMVFNVNTSILMECHVLKGEPMFLKRKKYDVQKNLQTVP